MFTVEPRQWAHRCQLYNSLNFSKYLKNFITTIGKVTCFAQRYIPFLDLGRQTYHSLFVELFGEPE